MDVKLPDGRIVKNIPDGTTKAQLAEKLTKNGITVPKEWMTPTATAAPAATAAPEQSALSKVGNFYKDNLEAGAQFGTGMVGSVVGDVAGLGAMGVDAAGRLFGNDAGQTADPTSIRDKVANALTYHASNPDNVANKIAALPGKALNWSGDKLVEATHADEVPYLDRVVHAIPLAAASLLGVKGPKGLPKGAAPIAEEEAAIQARANSTVNPEAPPTAQAPQAPPAQLALPAPEAAGLPTKLPGNVVAEVPPPPGRQGALPGPEPTGPAPEMKSANMPPEAPAPQPVPKTTTAPKARKNATPEQLRADAVKVLLDNDIGLMHGQRGIGFKANAMQSAGRGADALLGTSKKTLEQMQDFTAAVFNKVGIKARNATQDAMQELKQSVENGYEAAHKDAHVKMDGELIADLNELRDTAKMTAQGERVFDTAFDYLQRNAKADAKGVPVITAELATKLRARLGKLEGSGDSTISGTARELKDAFDAAAERSATPAQAALLKEARGKYHFMRQIEGAITHGEKGSYISPSKLLNVINRKRNKNEAVYGRGDQSLVELAEAGKKVLPDSIGNSGTAARHMDVAKIVGALSHPLLAAKAGGAILGGRLLNQRNMRAGTPSYAAAKAAVKAKGSNKVVTALRGATAISSEQENKKRQRQAEALRSN